MMRMFDPERDEVAGDRFYVKDFIVCIFTVCCQSYLHLSNALENLGKQWGSTLYLDFKKIL